MASTTTKVFLGLGCALVLSFGFALTTCAGCMASMHSELPASSPASSGGEWKGGVIGRSPMDDSVLIQFHVDAVNELQGWRSSHRPRVVAECREHKTNVYLITGMPLAPELGKFEKYTIRRRMDGRPFRTELWSESTDGAAVFSPSAIALSRELAKTKEMLIEVTPFHSSPQTIIFTVSGFSGPLQAISEACQWKP